MKNQSYRFFFHYNKPASKQAGRVKWSVHFRSTCSVVDSINCTVPCKSKVNKRQPYAVMIGTATNVTIVTENGISEAMILGKYDEN
jgi:hypothetical protein